MYGVLYIAYVLALLFMGFAMTSRGAIFTQKVKAATSLTSLSLGVVILIVAFLEKSLVLGVLCIVLYFVAPGVGQTLTLIALKEKYRISPLSWIMTVLFFAAAVYVIVFGRIV